MRKLLLLPDKSTYVATFDANGRGSLDPAIISGIYAKGIDSLLSMVSVTWVCLEEEFVYLQAFMRSIGHGSEPFLMDLLLDTLELEEYTCCITPGSFVLSTVQGQVRSVTAQVVAMKNAQRATREYNTAVYPLLSQIPVSYKLTTLDTLTNQVIPDNIGEE